MKIIFFVENGRYKKLDCNGLKFRRRKRIWHENKNDNKMNL